MDDTELDELQRPETWENGDGELRAPVKAPRAIVSVAFSRDDFQHVAKYAKQHGMKTSEFIRRAALERVAAQRGQAVVLSVSGAVRTGYPPSFGSRPRVEIRVAPPAVLATA